MARRRKPDALSDQLRSELEGRLRDLLEEARRVESALKALGAAPLLRALTRGDSDSAEANRDSSISHTTPAKTARKSPAKPSVKIAPKAKPGRKAKPARKAKPTARKGKSAARKAKPAARKARPAAPKAKPAVKRRVASSGAAYRGAERKVSTQRTSGYSGAGAAAKARPSARKPALSSGAIASQTTLARAPAGPKAQRKSKPQSAPGAAKRLAAKGQRAVYLDNTLTVKDLLGAEVLQISAERLEQLARSGRVRRTK